MPRSYAAARRLLKGKVAGFRAQRIFDGERCDVYRIDWSEASESERRHEPEQPDVEERLRALGYGD